MEETLKKLIRTKSGSTINRPRRPDQWKRNRQKTSRVSGQAYENTKGIIVLEKRFRVVEKCCTLECTKKVDVSSQQYLFDEFWKRGKSKQIQDLNLASCLRRVDVKRHQVNPNTNHRSNQWQYYVRLGSVDVRVCRSFIDNLYQIGEKRIRVIQQKIVKGETSFHEKRGHHNNRPHRTPENVLPLMKEHLSSLSLDESFFFSSKGNENTRLDFKKLYNSFSQYYQEKIETMVPISERMYQNLFRRNSDFIFASPTSVSTNDEYLSCADVEVLVFPPEVESSSQVLVENTGSRNLSLLDGGLHNGVHDDHNPLLPDHSSNEIHNNHNCPSLPFNGSPEISDEGHINHHPLLPVTELADDPNDTQDNQMSSSPTNRLVDPNETREENILTKKPFQPVGSCCIQKCYQKFDVPSQQYLYDEFWNRGKSKQIQDLYLASCLKKASTKTHLANSRKSHRQQWHFFVHLGSIDVRVCLSFIVNLYHVSIKRIRVIQSKVLRGETSFLETRGRRNNQRPKLPAKIIPLMKKHLALIPNYESTDVSSRRHFENPDLDLKKLFKAFREYYEETMSTALTIEFRTYAKLFRSHSEFTFSSPVANQCEFCVSFKSSALPTEDQLTAKMAHEDFCSTFIELKDHLLTEAKKGTILMIEFDYVPSICVPRLNVAQELYKRLPSVYGFNVHNHCDDSSFMYLFPEGKAVKNIDSIISFIFATIQPILESTHSFQRVILLCNDCEGQSKQMLLVQFCSWMSAIHRISVQQVFPVQGHSINICSHNFTLFRNKNKKRARLIDVKPILEDMVSARPHPSPFIVSFDSPIVDRWSEALAGFFAAQPRNNARQKFLMQSYMQLEHVNDKIYANSTFYSNPELWMEFRYFIKNIDVRNIVLQPSIPPGVVPAKRENVFSFFHLLTSDEIIKFQESFGV